MLRKPLGLAIALALLAGCASEPAFTMLRHPRP